MNHLELFKQSKALTHTEPQTSSELPQKFVVELAEFFAIIKDKMKTMPRSQYLHQEARVGFAHALCDIVSQKTVAALQKQGAKTACTSGCDACCYYTEPDATAIEFEQILHYLKKKLPRPLRAQLIKQWREADALVKHGFAPCPFLDTREGKCAVYAVRPMGCRGLLATSRCQLENAADNGLGLVMQLVAENWTSMPITAGNVLIALESELRGEKSFNLKTTISECLVRFKALEKPLLIAWLEK